MNKLLLCISFVLMSVAVSAQKVYFIYLQSESEEPFFVKMNEKVHSSSSTGYLILSKLVDSTYSFSVGFPQNKWPEQKFAVTLNRKDQGYMLKNFGDKGWGLFNLQSLEVVMTSSAGTAKTETPVKEENKNVSAFTDILSKAADDPSLKEKTVVPVPEEKKKPVAVKPEVKPETKEEAKKEDVKKEETREQPAITKPVETTPPPVVKKEETKTEIIPLKQEEGITKPAEKKDTVAVKPVETPLATETKTQVTEVAVKEEQSNPMQEEYKRSTVSKRSESSTTEGFGLTFIDDQDNGIKDTIRILIPNPKTVVAVKEQPKEEKKFLDIQATPTTEPVKEEVKTVVTPVSTETTAPVAAKINCSETATEADFLKLRKTMAAAENDDDMISEAKKQFRIKCFTTLQIKNLGALFLNDENKYRFFDAAYNYTSDKELFGGLQAELKDEYYINRFKAMLRN